MGAKHPQMEKKPPLSTILHHPLSPVFMGLPDDEWRILGFFFKFLARVCAREMDNKNNKNPFVLMQGYAFTIAEHHSVIVSNRPAFLAPVCVVLSTRGIYLRHTETCLYLRIAEVIILLPLSCSCLFFMHYPNPRLHYASLSEDNVLGVSNSLSPNPRPARAKQ